MEIFQIVGLALVAAVLSVLLRNQRPEIALQVSIVTGVIIFLLMAMRITTVITVLQDIAKKLSIDLVYLTTVLKIIGIAYLTTFGAEVCRDAGENAIASKVEFAGKIMIMILAIPILMAVLDIMTRIMP